MIICCDQADIQPSLRWNQLVTLPSLRWNQLVTQPSLSWNQLVTQPSLSWNQRVLTFLHRSLLDALEGTAATFSLLEFQ